MRWGKRGKFYKTVPIVYTFSYQSVEVCVVKQNVEIKVLPNSKPFQEKFSSISKVFTSEFALQLPEVF